MDSKIPSIASIEIPCEDARIGQVLDALEQGIRNWIDAAKEVALSLEQARAAATAAATAATPAADRRGSAAGGDLPAPRSNVKRVVALPPPNPKKRKRRQSRQANQAADEEATAPLAAEPATTADEPSLPTATTQQQVADAATLDRFATQEDPVDVAPPNTEGEDEEALLADLDPKIAKQLRIKRRLTNKTIRTLLDEMNE